MLKHVAWADSPRVPQESVYLVATHQSLSHACLRSRYTAFLSYAYSIISLPKDFANKNLARPFLFSQQLHTGICDFRDLIAGSQPSAQYSDNPQRRNVALLPLETCSTHLGNIRVLLPGQLKQNAFADSGTLDGIAWTVIDALWYGGVASDELVFDLGMKAGLRRLRMRL